LSPDTKKGNPAGMTPAPTNPSDAGLPPHAHAERRSTLATLVEGCPAADDALLCLSELATNAHAPRGALLYPRRSREELKGGSWA
jgi:hypothetical protein